MTTTTDVADLNDMSAMALVLCMPTMPSKASLNPPPSGDYFLLVTGTPRWDALLAMPAPAAFDGTGLSSYYFAS